MERIRKSFLICKRIILRITTITFTLIMFLTLIFTLVGCNNNNNNNNNDDDVREENGSDTTLPEPIPTVDVDSIVNPDRSLFDGETLTIAVFSDIVLNPIARLYMDENPGVAVEVIRLMEGDFLARREQIGVQLMAGNGPVLIESTYVDYMDPRISHFLVDWLPIIDADPNFNVEDWFMNVFNAIIVDGRLPVFPMEFAFDMIVANSAVPGLAEALADMDTITVPEMIRLHQELTTETPLYLDPNFDASWLGNFCLDGFMDFESGWVDFDNEQFISLLIQAREITNQDRIFGGWQSGQNVSPQEELEMSERYFFHTITGSSLFQHVINFDAEQIFTELTPLVNERGELQMEPFVSYALNANASPIQQALAWDFIRFVNDTENRDFGPIWMVPTNRELFELCVERNMINDRHVFNSFGWQVADGANEEDDIIVSFTEFAEMPMTIMGVRNIVPDAIATTILEILEQFNDGLITAEQAASDLQSRVSLILMEIGE